MSACFIVHDVHCIDLPQKGIFAPYYGCVRIDSPSAASGLWYFSTQDFVKTYVCDINIDW